MKRTLTTLAVAAALGLGTIGMLEAGDRNGGHGRHGRIHKMKFGLEHMTRELELTPEQKAQVGPIVEQTKPQIRAIREEAMQKTRAVMESSMAQIRPLLTAEQQAKLDKLQAAREKMREAREEMRDAKKS